MVEWSRRVLLSTLGVIFTGCTTTSGSETSNDATASTTATGDGTGKTTATKRRPATATPTESTIETPTKMATPRTLTASSTPSVTSTAHEPDVFAPTVSVPYGEPHTKDGLRLSVSKPIVSSTFRCQYGESAGDVTPTPGSTTTRDRVGRVTKTRTGTDAGDASTYEMPEGEALAFASVTFRNELANDEHRVVAPRFVVVHDGRTYPELLYIDHPELGTLEKASLGRVATVDSRWGANMFGVGLDPGERYATTLVFRVPVDTDPETDQVVFHPTLEGDLDQTANSAVEWH